ncbi:vacuolar alkaline phosphatase [Polyrhizophydium stewartii]|uniref:Copper homeostasis protein cutC homolog n=1 Tax=Polyrhizophydium stewartii TaxID=2732419 RepID=A0ABR4NKH6_9FUNG
MPASADSARPERNGAARVELCANLLEGGTTPSAGAIKLCCSSIKIPVHVMIRPRGGDFRYTDVEFETMRADIRIARSLGAAGVVLGLLNPDGTVDAERTAELVREAQPMAVTFHRAFDMTRDPFEALEALVRIGGIQRVLTSGQDSSVLEGLPLLKQLVERAGSRIQILPGGGVTNRNVARILAEISVPEIHMALPAEVPSEMNFRNPQVFMGVAITTPEYTRSTTDGAAVASAVSMLSRAQPN